MENVKVSVVIPAKNEALTIRDIIKEAKKYAFEVLVIDGNSQDDTRKIAEQEGAKVFQDAGTGKGKAVTLGIEEAQGLHSEAFMGSTLTKFRFIDLFSIRIFLIIAWWARLPVSCSNKSARCQLLIPGCPL